MWESVTDWVSAHTTLLFWVAIGSLVMLIGSALLLPIVIGQLPHDYFVNPQARRRARAAHPVRRILISIARNLLGLTFVTTGIAMLFLPGQGILTILLGLLLLELPGERTLFCRVAQRGVIFNALNWIRKKEGKLPFVLPERGGAQSSCAPPS